MDQPSHSYGLAGTNRREGFAPKSFRGFGVRRSAKGQIRRGELDAASESQTAYGEVLRVCG
jgi:hypothetical protein